jgi:hypothetical protein
MASDEQPVLRPFDESRLAKPSDWAALEVDDLESSMADLANDVDAAFEEA